MKRVANPLRIASYAQWAESVAVAYLDAPALEDRALPSYRALVAATDRFYPKIARKVRVEVVDGQPYASEIELRRDVAAGRMFVSRDFNTHPLFTPEQNLRLRVVHDWMAHVVPGARGPGFGQRGEIRAFNQHAKTLPPRAMGAAFTEVAAQAATFTVTGHFPLQKICLLPQFDWHNLGVIADARRQEAQLRQAGAAK